MQKATEPQFIRDHSGIVQGVAFDPMDRYRFCSGATDGKIIKYNALNGRFTTSVRMPSPNGTKNINAVKFNADGSRILTTTSKRLSVIDAERAALICKYEHCAYSGKERAPLATHPNNPNIAICVCTNGKGLITFDLRKHHPANFSLNVHQTVIKDIVYFDESWPFNRHESILSLGGDGVFKIRGLDDKNEIVHDLKNRSNCICPTPETYTDTNRHGLSQSMVFIGGDNLYAYVPGLKHEPFNFGKFEKPIYRMRFTSNGHFLYVATGEKVERYQRIDMKLNYLNEVYSHKDDIVDMDISKMDEFLITASKDGSVGLKCLGAPSHGWTAYMEIA